MRHFAPPCSAALRRPYAVPAPCLRCRHWIANPDLPTRFKVGAAWEPYNRATFYSQGLEGYLDCPFLHPSQIPTTPKL